MALWLNRFNIVGFNACATQKCNNGPVPVQKLDRPAPIRSSSGLARSRTSNRTGACTCLNSNVPWASSHNWKFLLCSSWKFAEEDWYRHSGGNIANMHMLAMCASNCPCTLATSSQALLNQGSQIFTRRRDHSGTVNVTIHVAILPSIVQCQCWCAVNQLPQQHPLSDPSQLEANLPLNICSVETTQTCIFLHVWIHPLPANSHQHLKHLLHQSSRNIYKT